MGWEVVALIHLRTVRDQVVSCCGIPRPRHDGLHGNRGIDPVIHNLDTRSV